MQTVVISGRRRQVKEDADSFYSWAIRPNILTTNSTYRKHSARIHSIYTHYCHFVRFGSSDNKNIKTTSVTRRTHCCFTDRTTVTDGEHIRCLFLYSQEDITPRNDFYCVRQRSRHLVDFVFYCNLNVNRGTVQLIW